MELVVVAAGMKFLSFNLEAKKSSGLKLIVLFLLEEITPTKT